MITHMRRTTSLALVVVLLFTLIVPGLSITKVAAATKNVQQSRRVADISEFPESYRDGLTRIKKAYPNARFVYYDTDLDWYSDVLQPENELKYGRNLITSSAPESWYSEAAYDASTQSYKHVEPGWIQASTEIIEYYMDPRNFLDSKNIFQFVALTYDASQTVAGVQSIINGSFMGKGKVVDNDGNSITYAEALVKIGEESGVSPYLLACRIIQEQGSGGKSSMISGTYSKVPGYYNHFNICAYGSTTEAILTNGLEHARSQGWDTPYKSLLGGAQVLAKSYVGAGKDCLYLHHWNMTAQNGTVSYNPYMTNLQAPYYEARTLAGAYTDKNANYTFIIPVYDNMPESVCELPDGEGHGYLLKNLSIDGLDFGKFNSRTYAYQTATKDASYVSLKITMNSPSSELLINGISINTDDTQTIEKALLLNGGFNTIKVTAVASNGISRDYTLTVANDDGKPHFAANTALLDTIATIRPNQTVEAIKNDIQTMNCSVLITDADGKVKDNGDLCAYGDHIVIKDNNNKMVYNASIVIDGDVNRDGLVNSDDLNMIKYHILEIYTLSIDELAIADLNFDGAITIVDLGMLKSLIQDDWTKYDANAELALDIPDTLSEGDAFKVSIIASEGTYCAEGYLIYNEGRLEAQGEENSGRIHFVVDGDEVLFDNKSDKVKFKTLIESGEIDFGIEVISAYDYALCREFSIAADSAVKCIKNGDVNVTLKLSSKSSDNTYSSATLTIKNIDDKSLGNITVSVDSYLTLSDGAQSKKLTGLKTGHKHSVKLYTTDNLSNGTYNSVVTIKYQNAECVEKLMSIPITFDVVNCDHTRVAMEHDNNKHTVTCKDCGYTTINDHVYVRTAEDLYACVECDYFKKMSLSIDVTSATMNYYTTVTPVLAVDDQIVSTSGADVIWYVDGVKTSPYKLTFNSVGHRIIDCVLTTKDGIQLCASTTIYVQQPPTYGQNPITVNSVTCSTIKLAQYENYEYKVDEGEWQDSSTFVNLEPGKEYVLHQRLKGSYYSANIRVKTNHSFETIYLTSQCSLDVIKAGICEFCDKQISATIKDTARKHLFADYKITSEATCQHGSTAVSRCAYGCGVKDEIVNNDQKSHIYSTYIPSEDFNCEGGGLMTAECDYHCGATSVLPNEASFGHDYIYVADKNATVTTSMTETGKCKYCDKTNTRTIDGTRLIRLTELNVTLSSASTGHTSLPTVVADNGVVVVDAVWETSDGKQYSSNSQLLTAKQGETYKLVKLILKADGTHAIHEGAALYVNGSLVTDDGTLADGIITFVNIGQFKF